MMKAHSARTLLAILPVTAVVVALSSCAGTAEVPGDYPDISLAQSKSPTQLLRNETAARVPADVVEGEAVSEDMSIACLSSGVDPQETVRLWRSTAQLPLRDDSSEGLTAIVGALVASYEEQGWAEPARGGTGRNGSKLLFSDSTAQSIQIVGLLPGEVRTDIIAADPIDQASILIVVNGPCVRTDGAESNEVKQLDPQG